MWSGQISACVPWLPGSVFMQSKSVPFWLGFTKLCSMFAHNAININHQILIQVQAVLLSYSSDAWRSWKSWYGHELWTEFRKWTFHYRWWFMIVQFGVWFGETPNLDHASFGIARMQKAQRPRGPPSSKVPLWWIGFWCFWFCFRIFSFEGVHDCSKHSSWLRLYKKVAALRSSFCFCSLECLKGL